MVYSFSKRYSLGNNNNTTSNSMILMEEQIAALEEDAIFHGCDPHLYVPETACNRCFLCSKKFNTLMRRKKFNCSLCGELVCRSCQSPQYVRVIGTVSLGSCCKRCILRQRRAKENANELLQFPIVSKKSSSKMNTISESELQHFSLKLEDQGDHVRNVAPQSTSDMLSTWRALVQLPDANAVLRKYLKSFHMEKRAHSNPRIQDDLMRMHTNIHCDASCATTLVNSEIRILGNTGTLAHEEVEEYVKFLTVQTLASNAPYQINLPPTCPKGTSYHFLSVPFCDELNKPLGVLIACDVRPRSNQRITWLEEQLLATSTRFHRHLFAPHLHPLRTRCSTFIEESATARDLAMRRCVSSEGLTDTCLNLLARVQATQKELSCKHRKAAFIAHNEMLQRVDDKIDCLNNPRNTTIGT